MSHDTRQPGEPARRVSGKRIVAILALSFAAFMTYRVFGVYTVRVGECAPPGTLLVPSDRRSITVDGDRVAYFPPRSPAAHAAPSLLVMSYNIEGHAARLDAQHLEEIAEVIRRHNPDVVGLQEVHRRTWQSRFEDQAERLAHLTGMKAFFGRSFSSWGGEYGNAVLTRWEIGGCLVHELPSLGEPRSLTECRIRIGENELSFFVTHLTTWGRLRRRMRAEQIECLMQLMRRSERPYILVGDFNASPSTPEMVELLRSDHLRACGAHDHPTHRLTRQHIDYIFSDHGWQTRSARVVREGPSDHWPLIAELRWIAAAGTEAGN
ncbi:MAG TPA: endonuclease/exonuclease/phosphatase family protein [Thermoanaerobaculia bacterium]|nr:endonuclease/exonuclease/phosphatase family protein [Thermoanaerobaculia bacterium]